MQTMLGWLALNFAACSADPPPTPAPAVAEKPDVIVILIDTLRVDRLRVHGYTADTAPFLTALAAQSAVFAHAWSTSSWTAPATASVFTGLYPLQHGVVTGLFATEKEVTDMQAGRSSTIEAFQLPAELPTLPELFKAAGYQTFGAAANVNLGPELGFQRGFDQFHFAQQATARALATEVVSWKPQLDAGPAFVYLHFNDVHSPYLKREPWYQPGSTPLADMQAAYDSEIHYTDLYIQRLVEALGWQDDIVMVITDHGEEFEDHGQTGHLTSLHRELVQSLWIVHAPGVAPQRIQGNASLVDVLPTVLALSGVEPPTDRSGLSLAPQLLGTADLQQTLADRPVFHHRVERESADPAQWRELWGVTQRDRRLIVEGDDRLLYDVLADPHEQRDLSTTEPQTTADLTALLRDLQQHPGTTWSNTTTIELDPSLYEQLHTLGYVE